MASLTNLPNCIVILILQNSNSKIEVAYIASQYYQEEKINYEKASQFKTLSSNLSGNAFKYNRIIITLKPVNLLSRDNLTPLNKFTQGLQQENRTKQARE